MRVVDIEKTDILPVLLEEFKDHLRIDGADEDASLSSFLSVAVQLVEQRYDMAIIARSAHVFLDRWDIPGKVKERWWQGVAEGSVESLFCAGKFALLPVKPLISISQIDTQDATGDWQLWPAANYTVVQGLEGGVNRKSGNSWPVPECAKDGIRLAVTYGFSDTWNGIPGSLQQAVLMLAAFLYTNRGTSQTGDVFMASGVKPILSPYERKRL
ncbi:head-tail connector protein [Kordiimonas laminariae]|uniref:head-tail connector protein n=1 Tax=Kordiimonas laminariae TaxID=2917717 RepID=UPI001FF5DBFC|nr:phage head-tail connector protein [Kordiimonas laminariae]MCK0068041.1 phage head-tail connector protein [Kordiimonas laminariae]